MKRKLAGLPPSLFPEKIGPLMYMKELTLSQYSGTSHYAFALYKDAQGKRFVCKLWSGHNHDFSYHAICNEIAMYQFWSRINRHHGAELNRSFKHIHVPQLKHHSVSAHRVYLVMEYIQGDLLSKSNPREMWAAYEKIIRYFQLASSFNDQPVVNLLKRKTIIHYFVLSHLYFLMALVKYPQLLSVLSRCLITFYQGIVAVNPQEKMVFVHRDLGGYNNVFKKGKKLFILDFELACLSYQLVEIANIITTKWSQPRFIKTFFASPTFKSIRKLPNQLAVLKAFIMYGVLVDFATGRGKSKEMSVALAAHVQGL